MTRDELLKALNALVKNDNLKRHHLAAAACMKGIALYLKDQDKKKYKGIDEAMWEAVGLLHDADYERTKDRPVEHGMIVIDEVRSFGIELPSDVAQAIKFHNFENTHATESPMGWAIYTCDPLTGLIVACAQTTPDHKLAGVSLEMLSEKFNDTSFAKEVSRDKIKLCEEKLAIKLEDFQKICLTAMLTVAEEIGL